MNLFRENCLHFNWWGVHGGHPVSEWRIQMTTKLIIIVAVSVAAVVLMFVLGKLADGKDKDQEK